MMELAFERLSRTEWSPPLVGSLFTDRGMCGISANGGLLRFHDAHTGPIGQEFVDTVFGTRGLPADVFAYDWRARQFAVTTQLDEAGQVTATRQDAVVVALDPFDMSIAPWVPPDLFERALGTSLAQESLDPRLFDEWCSSVGIPSLALDECAGATMPGFYRGRLAVDNLTHDSMEIYLSFTAQLWDFAVTQKPGDPTPHLRLVR